MHNHRLVPFERHDNGLFVVFVAGVIGLSRLLNNADFPPQMAKLHSSYLPYSVIARNTSDTWDLFSELVIYFC